MSNEIRVNIIDPRRAETFQKVFGRTEVAVLSPIPEYCTLPGFDEPQWVYKLDLDELTTDELDRLKFHLADTFHMTVSMIEEEMQRIGVPIPVDKTILTVEGTAAAKFADIL